MVVFIDGVVLISSD